MKHLLVAVYDAKAEAFNAPITVISKGAAIRAFGDALSDGKSEFAKHPEDYSLFYVGDWDSLSGSLEAVKVPVRIITALECLPSLAA